jgi:hypothetical protein
MGGLHLTTATAIDRAALLRGFSARWRPAHSINPREAGSRCLSESIQRGVLNGTDNFRLQCYRQAEEESRALERNDGPVAAPTQRW